MLVKVLDAVASGFKIHLKAKLHTIDNIYTINA